MQTRLFFPGVVIGSLLGVAAFSQPSPIQIPARSDQDPSDPKSGVIQGQVFAAEGEHPLARATVTIYPAESREGNRPQTVRTGDRGEYEFRGLEAGEYFLRAARFGFLRQTYGRKPSSKSERRRRTTILSLALGQVLDGIDFKLIRGGVVEGTVVDQYNEPRPRVSVTLSKYGNFDGERKLVPEEEGETDDRGRFRLFDIPPGSYYLSTTVAPSSGGGKGKEGAFPPVYYPGVLSPGEAAKVEVGAGEELGGFYLTLIEARSYSASGRVLTAEGEPARRVWIVSNRESRETLFARMEPNATTNRQGEFKVTGLLPGKHRLNARSRDGEKGQTANQTVEVADQDIEGLTLVLGPGAEITGRIVTDRQASDLDWSRIRLHLNPIDVDRWNFFSGGTSRVEEDFTFRIANLPEATYRFVVGLPPWGNHYVESIRILTEELIDRPIKLRNADRLDGVEIHVSSEGAQVSGVVKKEQAREVVPGATVVVFAADSEHRGVFSRFTKTVHANQQGRFSIKGLPPARYLVCALTDHESGIEASLDYLRRLERDSEQIELSRGQTLEKDLVASPAPKVY